METNIQTIMNQLSRRVFVIDKEMEDNWLMYTSKKTVLCMGKP